MVWAATISRGAYWDANPPQVTKELVVLFGALGCLGHLGRRADRDGKSSLQNFPLPQKWQHRPKPLSRRGAAVDFEWGIAHGRRDTERQCVA